MKTLEFSFLLLSAILASSYLARMLPISLPTPIIQIILGYLIAATTNYGLKLDPDIFFLLFLPPLLFLDGWRIPKDGLLRDKTAILQLALGLVVFTVIGMGFIIHWMIPAMPLTVAFALAAIISPTDPVAVSSITERIPVPKRLMRILEGESLLNDASGLVCFRFAIVATLTGSFSLSQASLTFLWVSLAGLGIGILVMLGSTLIQQWFSRRFGEENGTPILLSLLVPFAAYLLAEHINASGILAAVAAGITMSYVELSGKALARTRIQRTAAWDTLHFTLNGAMFILLGEQLPGIFNNAVTAVTLTGHSTPWWLLLYVFVINAGLVLLRFGWVWLSLYMNLIRADNQAWKQLPLRQQWKLIAVISVAGVRGSITLAGVLTIPLLLSDGTPFPARDLAIFLAAAIILLSLITASIALPRLLAGLEIPAGNKTIKEEEFARTEAALAAIEALRKTIGQSQNNTTATDDHPADSHTTTALRMIEFYQERINSINARNTTNSDSIRRNDQAEHQLRLIALQAERKMLFQLARDFRISDTTTRKLVRELDLLESQRG